ncbi:CTAG/PCC1 family protein [Candidatus Parvarchaeota archaeon]|nr:CTAG/PCC1 family protein [Candidatus Parvarchaeota archaeon]
MSKQGNPFSASIRLTLDKNLLRNLFHALSYNVTNDRRVKTQIKLKSDNLGITINANDFNMLLAVNNSIMQSIKMLETINEYE